MKNESSIPAARVLAWILAAVGVGEAVCWLKTTYLSVGAGGFFMGSASWTPVIATLGMLALCFAAGLRVTAAVRMHKAPDEEAFGQTRKLLSRSLLLSILGVLPFLSFLALYIYILSLDNGSAWTKALVILEGAMYLLYIPVMLITRGWKIRKVSMKGTGRAAAACALAAVLAVGGAIGYAAYLLVPAILARQNITAFHSFEAADINGEPVTQELLKGKVTLLNVWETTCGPCRLEMPALEELSQQYADSNVQIAAVCLDVTPSKMFPEPHSVEEAKQILEDCGVTYLNLVPDQTLADQLNSLINAFPTTFVLDENGNVLELIEGSKDKEAWELVIQKYLN